MGKGLIPLVHIPTLKANRSENNGRLLRKPQKPKLEPLRACISPPDTPDLDEESYQIESYQIRDRYIQSANSSIPPPGAGHTTPRLSLQDGSSPAKLANMLKNSYELPSHLTSIEDIPEISVQVVKQQKTLASALAKKVNTVPSSKQILKPTLHAGPEGLAPPEPRKSRSVIPFEMRMEKGPSEVEYMKSIGVGTQVQNDPALSIGRFMNSVADKMHIPLQTVQTAMSSSANVKLLTNMVHEYLLAKSNSKQGKITMKNLSSLIPEQDLPYRPSSHAVTGSRVPQKQILVQMASMLTEQIQATMEGRTIKALIRPFPKWSPNKPIDEMPKAEIVLYEELPSRVDSMALVVRGEMTGTLDTGIIMQHTQEKHFMDSRRNHSPFEFAGENGLDSTDIAVLDALVTGGAVLSLKAHFLEKIPDISPITHTLRYINLSFNNFQSIPPEVLLLHNLEVLKLRNNPIREIPDEIRHLKCLRTFEMPFCLVSSIPEGLFTLKHLQYLDLSFNKLTFMPTLIRKLRSLQVLFVEGNQLAGLPCQCLGLRNLHYIRVRNNFMHKIFWPDSTKKNDEPVKLKDQAGLLMKQLELDKRYGDNLPQAAKDFLNSTRECDCCHGHLVGDGLTLIRPGSLYGVKNVPFLFKSCSHYCAKLFMNNTNNLLDLVYPDSDHAEEEEEE